MHRATVEEALREIRKLTCFIDLTDLDDTQTLTNRLARLQLSVTKALQGMAIPDSYDMQHPQPATPQVT